jgi:hypothetical protein
MTKQGGIGRIMGGWWGARGVGGGGGKGRGGKGLDFGVDATRAICGAEGDRGISLEDGGEWGRGGRNALLRNLRVVILGAKGPSVTPLIA